jgi:hypothetical protein
VYHSPQGSLTAGITPTDKVYFRSKFAHFLQPDITPHLAQIPRKSTGTLFANTSGYVSFLENVSSFMIHQRDEANSGSVLNPGYFVLKYSGITQAVTLPNDSPEEKLL